MTDIAEKLGGDPGDYPNDSYDIIWTQAYPYDDVDTDGSEQCPGLDD